jgi:hypothetical protein
MRSWVIDRPKIIVQYYRITWVERERVNTNNEQESEWNETSAKISRWTENNGVWYKIRERREIQNTINRVRTLRVFELNRNESCWLEGTSYIGYIENRDDEIIFIDKDNTTVLKWSEGYVLSDVT